MTLQSPEKYNNSLTPLFTSQKQSSSPSIMVSYRNQCRRNFAGQDMQTCCLLLTHSVCMLLHPRIRLAGNQKYWNVVIIVIWQLYSWDKMWLQTSYSTKVSNMNCYT